MKKHIVIIEDDNDDLMNFLDAVEGIPGNFKCTHANCPAKGLNMLQYLEADYIFVDYNLPGLNGVDVISEIKKDSRFANTPVYLLSSSISTVIRTRAETAGATHCFHKPGTQKELNDILSAILAPAVCHTGYLNEQKNCSPEARWGTHGNKFYKR